MKHKLLTIILSLFVLFTVGCTKNYDNIVDSNDKQGHSNNEGKVIGSPESQSTVPEVVSDLKLDGDIKNIYYANENKILIAADKLYLYDLDTGNVLKESPPEPFDSENFWVINNGFVAVRELLSSDSSESMMTAGGFSYKAMFYDHDLNTVSEFDLNQLFEDDDMLMSLNAISFSSTGNQVAYATYSGLYIYDFEKETKTKVIDLESVDAKERSGIVNIEQIGFTNDDKRIAFKAQSFDIPANPDKPSYDTCGIVNVDGSGLLNKTFDNYICKRLTAYNDVLLFAQDPTIATGKTLVMEIPSDKTKIHTQIEKVESGSIWGSNTGGYFATSISHETGWTIRVYNTETGKLEAEQQVSNDGEERYMDHDPIIKVIDDTRTYIVLLGAIRDDIETKMIVSQF
ncbi:transcriptional regulator [Bacillus sp. FJAT-49705]|uniref:Transcriptional regulator n=1 Tax=Cytobacillus citreus TaxID=2833586 RepID=A0ABS5NPJ9_9BACI|nr:transcriptional regulator [Cytobacillus citreus]MBS4189762.1 transcriptional regulator [Cytobacillus citreus]